MNKDELNFLYCWEYKNCNVQCSVRERQTLFCWRAEGEVGIPCRSGCELCEYRLKWVHGEFTVEGFVNKFNQRTAAGDGRKVLVVDDDPSILFALEETVTFLGHESLSASDGEEGLILAMGILPDLIITDAVMPKIDGFELCIKVKSDPRTRHIPVIMVTALDQKRDAATASMSGTDAFITKPFKARELEGAISHWLPAHN